jgi:DNA-binding transcriptional regulator GbsR (MarR family)
MNQHKAISTIVLIGVLTLASIGNIHAKIVTYHDGWTALLIAAAFGIGLAVLVYVVMIAQTNRTRWTAALLSLIFGAASATLQVALYVDESAAMPVAFALGVTVPLMEAALAIVEALLRHEIDSKAEASMDAVNRLSDELSASRQTAANLDERNQKLTERVDRQLSEIDGLSRQLEAAKMAAQTVSQSSQPVSTPSGAKLTPADRQASIYQILMDKGAVNLSDLTDEFGVSINTVKNDIKKIDGAELTGDGAVRYVNGVAL